jgi:hypothetical protein
MGGKRPGAGRPKGAVSKVRLAQKAEIAKSGLTPLAYMLQVMRDENATQWRRDWAALQAAPYCHSKLASIEHTGKDGTPLQVNLVIYHNPA